MADTDKISDLEHRLCESSERERQLRLNLKAVNTHFNEARGRIRGLENQLATLQRKLKYASELIRTVKREKAELEANRAPASEGSSK